MVAGFFRCESVHLQTHWVMLVIDQYSRKIIGFAIKKGELDGRSICCMFNQIMVGKQPPKYLSTDNDPLFQFHQWKANLRIREIEDIKSIPHVPTSHPFIERVIGTVRQELLSNTLFWNERDLENKLNEFMHYYNQSRVLYSLNGQTPAEKAENSYPSTADFENYTWQSHCRGLFQKPVPA